MNKNLTFKPDLVDRVDTTIKKKKAVVAKGLGGGAKEKKTVRVKKS